MTQGFERRIEFSPAFTERVNMVIQLKGSNVKRSVVDGRNNRSIGWKSQPSNLESSPMRKISRTIVKSFAPFNCAGKFAKKKTSSKSNC